MIYVDLLVVARHVHVILNVKEYLTVSADVLRDVDADSGVQFPFKSRLMECLSEVWRGEGA